MIKLLKIIIGLGNYGNKYINTRHNMGSFCLLEMSKRLNIKFKKNKSLLGYIGNLFLYNKNIILFIPDGFINNSGQSISLILKFYKINLNNILIIHDELDFYPGIAKFKYGGSSGGHNGLKNIICCLQSQQFYRLRIGIGKPNNKLQTNIFVLNKPKIEEQKKIFYAINKSICALKILIQTNNYCTAINFLHDKTRITL
ncbi:aminoacyl-tRNA hydrolase [Enterobacteriaceae endosymbiont of Macroplea mutica]|nr:aminoacyl-tRNA hydrolase [Enterobacteriaceae endosymbiont of Macroplea mutica]